MVLDQLAPDEWEARAGRLLSVFGLLRDPAVALGMAAVSVFFMGHFSLYTYVRPFLETVTEVNVSPLSLLLLANGSPRQIC